MPSMPGAPRLALTRFNARSRFSRSSTCSSRAVSVAPGSSCRGAAVSLGTVTGSWGFTPTPRSGSPNGNFSCLYDAVEPSTVGSLTDVRPFPPGSDPSGTTTSADFSWFHTRLSTGVVGHRPTTRRSPRVRTQTFTSHPPGAPPSPLVPWTSRYLARSSGLDGLVTRFVCLGSRLCLGLPPDPASRRRPCLWLAVRGTTPRRGLAPPSLRPCRAHKNKVPSGMPDGTISKVPPT